MFNWKHRNRRAELASLRAGKIPVPPTFGLGDIDYTAGIDWSAFNDQPPPVRWWLNNLKYTRPLFLSGTKHDIEIATRIIRSWVHANSYNPQSDFAWDGHATAFRSEHIACLKTHIDADWLDQSAIQHAEFLCSEENYQGSWNHGLDQNIGLLSLGYAFNQQAWIELARERSIEAISSMVDWQGVSIEQAISYHFYNYVRFQDAEAMFRECGSPLPPEIFERVESMTTFLAHATKPNGAWNCLGDSTDDPNERERLDNTDAGFALSRGAKGIRPGNRFAIYHSGYIFGRTGWGETRPFDQEAYYSLRFGPGRMIHGHNDHTSVTYASRGRDFLVDGGFHGYTQDKWRDHLRNPSAHNVVYTTDQANFYWNAHTKLSEFQIESTWQNYKLVDTPYHRTERTRSVFFIQEPIEAMLVLDHLKGPTRNYEQVWHFDQAISLTNDHGIIKASTDGACATIQQLWPYDSIAIVEGQNEPPQGWAGYGTFDLRPIPTLLTAGSGGNVAFLTAIVIHEGEIPQISQRPVRRDEVTRNISIQVGSKKITISIMNNNTMKLASKEN